MLSYATLKHNHGQKGAAGNNCNWVTKSLQREVDITIIGEDILYLLQ